MKMNEILAVGLAKYNNRKLLERIIFNRYIKFDEYTG